MIAAVLLLETAATVAISAIFWSTPSTDYTEAEAPPGLPGGSASSRGDLDKTNGALAGQYCYAQVLGEWSQEGER